eukprot:scaffold43224_cov64-Phaeocystis_antarctica.AAC.1
MRIDAGDHQCGQAAPDAKPPVREHPRYCLSRRCERTLAVVSLNGFRAGAETAAKRKKRWHLYIRTCSLQLATEPGDRTQLHCGWALARCNGPRETCRG